MTGEMVDGIIDEPLADYDAVCLTPGCENEGIPIRVRNTVTDPHVYCGACTDADGYNTRITTLIPVGQ